MYARDWIPIFLFLTIPCNTVRAEMHLQVEDAVEAERTLAMVVGHIKDGSIQYVPTDRKYRVMLAVTQVLKGELKESEIPIALLYRIEPAVSGNWAKDGSKARGSESAVAGQIDLYDTSRYGGLILANVEKDNLWFLTKSPDADADFVVIDREDVQPLNLRDYFKAYLENDPASAVKAYVARNPAEAKRAERYLDHCAVRLIVGETDIQTRATKLLPYVLKLQYWSPSGKNSSEAYFAFLACGQIIGPMLMEPFNDPKNANRRDIIMRIWAEIGYTPAVDILIKLLKERDEFWAAQTLKGDWWNAAPETELTQNRRLLYGDVYTAVFALGKLNDKRARDAIVLTRDRWNAIHFANPQIVEACEAALKAMGQ